MDREFASAAKSREKERKQRVDEARKKLAIEKKKSEIVKIEQERIALVTTQRRAEEAAATEAAEAQAQAEQELTGGITFCQVLTAVPISSEGERIVLPPSALQTLETQSALDVAKPLGFEVCALDSTGAVVSKTHCGVLEFTAEEGTVGVPPAAALSLTKEAGVGALRDCRIRVKFVKLATPPKSFIRLQPRGHGFHTNGEDVVNLDLKAVLERELSRHTAVTKGDWIAIRSDKTTYELVVVDLEPCSALALTSTDLEVDLLPSESAVAAAEERELKKREAEQAQEKVAAAALLAAQAEAERRAKIVAAAETAKASLPPEPDAASSSSSCSAELSGRVVNVLVRLPSGAQLSRRFRQTDPLAALFSFVASEKQVCEDLALAATNFALNMNYPKKSFTLEDCAGSAEAEAGGSGSGPTLGGAGLTGRREALFLQDLTPSPREADEDLQVAAREVASAPAAMEDDDDGHGSSGGGGGGCVGVVAPLSVAPDSTGSSSSSSGGQQPLFPQLNSSPTNVWATAADEHRAQLDRALSSEAKDRTEAGALIDGDGGGDAEGAGGGGGGGGGEGGGGVDKVSVFHMLVDRGLSHAAAAQAAQKYSEQLVELDRMGFGSADAATSVSLLERYGGRMLRVVNALSERALLPKEEGGATLRGSGGGGSSSSSSSSDQGRREGGVGAREQDATATRPLLQAAAVVAEAAPSAPLAPLRPLEVATFQTKFAELVSAGVAPNEAAAQALHLMQQQPGQQAQTSSVSGGSSSGGGSGDCSNAMQVDSSYISSSPLSQATATTTTAPVIGVGVDAGLGGMDGGGRWASELSELASMGFSDSGTNAALLERYQGRLVRVINALTGGD